MTTIFAHIARIVVGSVLFAAAATKVLQFKPFVTNLATLRVLPLAAVAPVSALIVLLEGTTSVLLFLTSLSSAAAIAGGTFITFACVLALTANRAQESKSCNCFGRPTKITWSSVMRNLSLASLCGAASGQFVEAGYIGTFGMLALAWWVIRRPGPRIIQPKTQPAL